MKTLQLLQKLVSIPSESFHEQKISAFLTVYLKDLGFSVKIVTTGKDRNNIVATFGVSSAYLGFYGHIDTVQREKEKGINPYKMIAQGNKAFGLGTEDMKGGVSCILQMGAFAVKNNLPVKIVFGVDEEEISEGAHDLVDSGFLKDVAFLIAAESGQIQNMNQSYNVCYGRKGRILFDLKILGKKVHAAEAQKGINAIEKAAEIIKELKEIKFKAHKNLGKTTLVVHSIQGTTDSFSVPDSCRVLFSLLSSPLEKSAKFIKQVKQIAKKRNTTIEIKPGVRETPYGESYEINASNTFITKLNRNVFIRDKVKPIYTGSVADENVFANRLKIPVISIGSIGGGGHTKDEWLDLSSLEKVESLYKEIVVLYNQEEKSS